MSIDQWREFELSRSNRNTDTAASSHKTNDELSPTNKTNKSNGISPSSFYKKNKTQPSTYSEQQLDNILNLASKNEVVQKRREFTSKHKAKEDAYDDVTQFRIFPLQDLAMDFLDEMTKECFDSLSAVESDQAHPYQISSVTTMNEHKRRKTICNDDSLIQLREQYTVEFLREMKYHPPTKKHVECDSDGVTKSKEVKERAINENTRTVSNVDRAAMEDDAFEFLPVLWSMEPRIFAMETSSTGKRKYIVGNLGRFFHHYWKKSDPRSLHYYELIRDGTPVRLYFGA